MANQKAFIKTPARGRRGLLICGVAVIAILLLFAALVRHFSNPQYVEKRLIDEIGSGYLINIASSRYNVLSQHYHAEGLTVVPDTLQRASSTRPRRRSSFSAAAVEVNGINFLAMRKGQIDFNEIVIDQPEIRLVIDRRVPNPKATTPRRMPHEVIRSSSTRLCIDTIRVVDGDIRLSEIAVDGTRPGTFRFADLDATVANLTNDAKGMKQPCVIDVRTRLADSGPLKARFVYDFSSDVTRMDYHAVIGKMDAVALNDLLVDLKGVRVKEGTIDSTWLDIKVDGDVAAGQMRFLYHGLKFEILDKDSHEQGVGDHLATFMSSWDTHDSNPQDDEPATVITLRRERAPQTSLMKFVWETVREGILRTVGVQ